MEEKAGVQIAKKAFLQSLIIIFLLMVGTSFAVMDKSGLLKAGIARIVKAYAGRKYRLLALSIGYGLF